ncbi:MAG: FdhF/YdeP family oxidoreductase [Phycisphaerae bacterium]|jgi:molybdopterin-dependent oxidoreductase alpha subunit|nr:FdhF/YdeP family oxidoreductase [Phycisphaerae bacterium]
MAIGGFHSVFYVLKKARSVGGILAMWKAMRSPNACKTCAFGMGGQRGGMVNEAGKFPEFCKKSVQAMAADMQGAISQDFFERHTISQLSAMSPRELEGLGRITFPLYAGPLDMHYKPIDWDEALNQVGEKIKSTLPEKSFYYCSGRSSNEAGFLLQLLARIRGTNNINNCSYYCHQASGVGLTSVTGSGTATVQLEDLSKSDVVFLIGCNPPSNHPRLLKSLIDLRRRGGKVIVVNPLLEPGLCKFRVPSDLRSLLFGSTISDLYVQPHIGGDQALFMGILKWLDEHDAIDEHFVEHHAECFPETRMQARGISWDWIVEQSGVKLELIEEVSKIYSQSSATIFCWAMGITHTKGGVDGVRSIANVAIARGMLGKEGAGLLPLRGHSNVQGMGSVGVAPILKGNMARAIEKELSVTLPKPEIDTGDTMWCMKEACKGNIKYAMCLGGNLVGANPDTRFAMEAMSKIQLVTYLSTTLNQGHFQGRGVDTIIFPVLPRDEESQTTTQESMFNYVRRSSGGSPRHNGPRSEVSILVDIATKGVGVISWEKYRDHSAVRALLSSCITGFDNQLEHQIEGRTFHSPSFSTSTGKVKSHVIQIEPTKKLAEFQLRLMTIRSEGQFNTVVYEEEDVYRNQTQRDIIMMNEQDMKDMHLAPEERVNVVGVNGSLFVTVRPYQITTGNCAMYFPEANVLLSNEVDEESKTPLFKGTVVSIQKT